MIYLFYGEEKYELYKEVEKIKNEFESLEVGVNFFNISKENVYELDSLYEAVNFFGTNKLVIIKDTNLKFDVKKMFTTDSVSPDNILLISINVFPGTITFFSG